MSGPLGSSQWMYASGDFTLDQSLKLDRTKNTHLTKTFVSAGNRRTFTISCWLKMCDESTTGYIFEGGNEDSNGNRLFLRLQSDGELKMSEASSVEFSTNAKLRDPSAWYHIVVAIDTTQGTSTNRIKVYINGTQQTSFSSINYPTENFEYGINKAAQHTIGRSHIDNNNPINAYLAEFHFLDGVVKAASDFGKSGSYGEWKPIEYGGSYGTNGFYLPFNQDYEVEGFSTTIYKGSGVSGHYIGGAGFQPDLTWIKPRSTSDNSVLFDSVRGYNNQLKSNATDAEDDNNRVVNASDGFVLNTTDSNYNSSSHTYVAWNWDMGGDSYGLPSTCTAVSPAVHSTDQAKIGSTSMKFDGSSAKITVTDKAEFDFKANDFTIEWWQYRTGTVGSGQKRGIWRHAYGNTYSPNTVDDEGTMRLYLSSNNSAWNLANGLSLGSTEANGWHHYAAVRNGNTITSYKNGTLVSATTSSSSVYSYSGSGYVGSDASYHWEGFIDEFRISNKARYTSNFTAPTTAFSNDANTILLIHSDTSNSSTVFTDSSGAAKNTTGSITSYVAANTTYGQSIVSYTGNGTSGATVGHGLSSAPNMIIVKRRDATASWQVYHSTQGNGKFFDLHTTGAVQTATNRWNDTSPTSSLFSLGNNTNVNASSSTYIAYCFYSVTGYSSFGSYTGNGSTTGPSVTTGFKPAFLMIKETVSGGGWLMVDNTRNPTNPTTLRLNADTNGAEDSSADNNVDFNATGFQIKTSSGSWNQNGVSVIYMCFADKREYAYWLDQSGNNNDWTSNNLTESDISVDSPTNNFCTMNPLDVQTDDKLSEGNLFANESGRCRGTMAVSSGKWYFEAWLKYQHHSTVDVGIREVGGNAIIDNDTGSNRISIQQPVSGSGTRWTKYIDGTSSNSSELGTVLNDDIWGVAFDVDAETISWTRNGSAINAEFTDLDYSGLSNMDTVTPFIIVNGGRELVMNFGQDSSFAGFKTAQGNQDSNDIGDFYYEPPADYLALCTSNLPAVAVTPSKHFNTVLYTGDNATSLAITGVGFQPDFVWLKRRDSSASHHLGDAVRGSTKSLLTNGTNAENTSASDRDLRSFDSDGFTVGQDYWSSVNTSSATMVAWNWKANGSGSSNTNGSINTAATSANVDAGFSIISYTGTGSNATVGHGLSKAPELIIVKNRSNADGWTIFHDSLNTYYLEFTNAAQVDSDTRWNDTSPTSSVFTISTDHTVNASGENYIAYCFHSVDGYSKVNGFYIGNASTDGVFNYCGFSPRWIMIKRKNGVNNWYIYDTERTAINPTGTVLLADTNAAEVTQTYFQIDILSNGWKARASDGAINASGEYIFMAFAETPFKYSNAR